MLNQPPIRDANGKAVIETSEWLTIEEDDLELIVKAVNAMQAVNAMPTPSRGLANGVSLVICFVAVTLAGLTLFGIGYGMWWLLDWPRPILTGLALGTGAFTIFELGRVVEQHRTP